MQISEVQTSNYKIMKTDNGYDLFDMSGKCILNDMNQDQYDLLNCISNIAEESSPIEKKELRKLIVKKIPMLPTNKLMVMKESPRFMEDDKEIFYIKFKSSDYRTSLALMEHCINRNIDSTIFIETRRINTVEYCSIDLLYQRIFDIIKSFYSMVEDRINSYKTSENLSFKDKVHLLLELFPHYRSHINVFTMSFNDTRVLKACKLFGCEYSGKVMLDYKKYTNINSSRSRLHESLDLED